MEIDWKSAVLAGLVLPLVPISILIWQRGAERLANLFLIGLFVAWSLLSVPFVIGFMGAYQAYPWLTFAPFNTELWFGGLIWLYVVALTSAKLPDRWWWWLLPGTVQSLYYTVCFVGLGGAPRKFAYNNAVHEPFIVPVETLAGIGLMVVGLVLSWRQSTRYQAWLALNHGNKAEFDLTALRLFLGVVTGLGAISLFTDVMQSVAGKWSYPTLGLYYICLGAIFFALGLDRLSRVAQLHPKMTAEAAAPPRSKVARKPSVREIAAQIRAESWHLDPGLTIADLARRLGTNTSALSAAINGTPGLNFNILINQLRVEDVCRALLDKDDDRSLYRIALDHGFGSKATFNRVFKELVGTTPTQIRQGGDASQIPDF